MEIQTRSERNGLIYHTTLKDALEHAEKDLTVWKISFSLENGERVRLVSNEEGNLRWSYESII